MCKKIILICFFSIMLGAPLLKAQDAQLEAKAAYELAEDAYSKANYKSALNFLQQVKTSLGSTNCKILFLEIMVTQELLAKDTSRNTKLMGLITAFEKSTDYADFNQEKKMEIAKLKLGIKQELQIAGEEEAKRQEEIANRYKDRTSAHQANFQKEVNSKGDFNITIEELEKKYPQLKINKWVVLKVSPTVDLYYPPDVKFDASDFPFPHLAQFANAFDKLTGVYMKDGKLIGYQVMTNNFDQTGDFIERANTYQIWEKYQKSVPQDYSKSFFLEPVVTSYPIPATTATRYVWAEGKYGMIIDEMHYRAKEGGGYLKMVKTLYYNPTDKPTSAYHPSEK